MNSLLAQGQGQLSVHVLFVKPADTAQDWANTDLWRQAAAIPDVTVHCDAEGREARIFHSETSGNSLMYGRDGT
ncbi:MAG: hypothetical protein L0Z50_16910 [Verrucomicrobiales bacterium]|nr:hypothetical protein [Verrucomicrobiales bacterium]